MKIIKGNVDLELAYPPVGAGGERRARQRAVPRHILRGQVEAVLEDLGQHRQVLIGTLLLPHLG